MEFLVVLNRLDMRLPIWTHGQIFLKPLVSEEESGVTVDRGDHFGRCNDLADLDFFTAKLLRLSKGHHVKEAGSRRNASTCQLLGERSLPLVR